MDTYVVTERAGKRVAGRIVKAGDELRLTAAEAVHELREGTIVLEGKALDEAYTTDSDELAALRERAKGNEGPSAAPVAAAPEPASEEPAEAAAEPASKAVRRAAKDVA